MNNVTLMGRLTQDPELKQTPNGVSVATFSLAVNRNFQSKDGTRQADFINIVVWRGTADLVCKYFAKGQQVALEGSIQTRSYEDKQGNKRTAFEVVADQVYFAEGKSDSNTSKPKESIADFGDFDEIDDDDMPF